MANWFQPTAKRLADSTFRTTAYDLYDPAVALRLRFNETTGEAWFAAMRIGTAAIPTEFTVQLPRRHGKVTNLATGQSFEVKTATVQLPLTSIAQPHYFQP